MIHEGLCDHESFEPVPVELTGTCHYFQLFVVNRIELVRERKFSKAVIPEGMSSGKFESAEGEYLITAGLSASLES